MIGVLIMIIFAVVISAIALNSDKKNKPQDANRDKNIEYIMNSFYNR